MELQTAIQGLITGVLTGGTAAGTSLLGVFKSIRKRLHELEQAIGDKESDPPTGIYYQLDTMGKSLRNLRNEISAWKDDPPDWLVRIVQRANRASMSSEVVGEFEQRVESRLNSFKTSLQRLEDDLDRREARLEDAIGKSSPEFSGLIMRDEYERDSKLRAEEMTKLRESLKSSTAFLRGIMTAMGYVDAKTPEVPSTPPPPPPLPPRPVPRIKPPTPGRAFPPPLKKKP